MVAVLNGNEIERRKNERRDLEYRVRLGLDDGTQVFCRILNISAKGARFTLPTDQELPAEFDLLLSHDNLSKRKCRRIWQRECNVGVEFITDDKP